MARQRKPARGALRDARPTADPRAGPGPALEIAGPNYLTMRIAFLGKLVERQGARQLGGRFRLSLAEWRVLAQVAHCGPITVRELAERSWVDRAETSRAAASLVARGYVVRRSDPADGRSPLFSATSAGRRLYRAIRPVRRRFQAQLAAQMTRAELRSFLDVLDRLARCMILQERRDARER